MMIRTGRYGLESTGILEPGDEHLQRYQLFCCDNPITQGAGLVLTHVENLGGISVMMIYLLIYSILFQ